MSVPNVATNRHPYFRPGKVENSTWQHHRLLGPELGSDLGVWPHPIKIHNPLPLLDFHHILALIYYKIPHPYIFSSSAPDVDPY